MKKKTIIMIFICLIVIIGIGTSYGYYLANFNVENPENNTNNIQTQTLTQVVMDMQGKIEGKEIYPGHKMVKEVIVKGIGNKDSLPTQASIVVTPSLKAFTGDVIWKLYKSETSITCNNTKKKYKGTYYEEGTCMIPTESTLELKGESEEANKNITVYPNTETKYYLVVEYLNKENQNNQLDNSFSIEISISVNQ